MNDYKVTAVVLAAGQGKRMQSKIQKQYMLINDKPVLFYSLKAFEDSFVDHIVLVVGKNEEEYVQKEIIGKYSFKKISAIVTGGKERYHSVAAGVNAINWQCDFCMIHDGARPLITCEILERIMGTVPKTKACVVGMPIKDTVKIIDSNHDVTATPPRANVWLVQTPQTFEYNLIKDSYNELLENENRLLSEGVQITDDAMVVEYFSDIKVRLIEGSYENIKITTPDDLYIAKDILSKREN